MLYMYSQMEKKYIWGTTPSVWMGGEGFFFQRWGDRMAITADPGGKSRHCFVFRGTFSPSRQRVFSLDNNFAQEGPFGGLIWHLHSFSSSPTLLRLPKMLKLKGVAVAARQKQGQAGLGPCWCQMDRLSTKLESRVVLFLPGSARANLLGSCS